MMREEKRGNQEGKLEGKLEERKNLTKKLYEEKFTVAEISKLLKMKEDEVKEIINYQRRELIVADQLSL